LSSAIHFVRHMPSETMEELGKLLKLKNTPVAWADGGKIPWNEPGFSERMLREHLTQDHDLASRRTEHIESAVRWIHEDLLGGKPSRILDLGCGPGLYLNRLAGLGHSGVGLDFGPASIRYARETSKYDSTAFMEADLTEADFGSSFDLCLFLFGEFNAFPAEAALEILRKARGTASKLVIEVQLLCGFRARTENRSWELLESGLFCPEPHLLLTETVHDEPTLAWTTRFTFVILRTGEVRSYGHTEQAYPDYAWPGLLAQADWKLRATMPGLGPEEYKGLATLVAD